MREAFGALGGEVRGRRVPRRLGESESWPLSGSGREGGLSSTASTQAGAVKVAMFAQRVADVDALLADESEQPWEPPFLLRPFG